MALLTIVLRMPAAQTLAMSGLAKFGDIAEQIARFPCWLLDHKDCFSLDWFDPTCPQCR